MSTFRYLQQQKYEGERRRRQEREDRTRTQAMEDKQMQLLDAEIAALQNQGGGMSADALAEAKKTADEYLGRWNETLAKSEGLYSNAISEVGKAGELIDRAYSDIGKLDEIETDIQGEWEDFKTTFGDTKGKFLEAGEESLGQRGELRRQFMDLAKSDEEGAAGRAMADVAGQAEAGRRAEAMRLQGLGIDPTSGRARSFMQTSRDTEGLNKVMAANQARRGEKERVAGLTAQGLSLIDPSADVSVAAQIQNMQDQLLGQRTQMATTRAGLTTDLARSRGALATTGANIAGSHAQNIAAPLGEYGATMKGIQLGGSATADRSPMDMTSANYASLSTQQKADINRQKALDMRKQYYG